LEKSGGVAGEHGFVGADLEAGGHGAQLFIGNFAGEAGGVHDHQTNFRSLLGHVCQTKRLVQIAPGGGDEKFFAGEFRQGGAQRDPCGGRKILEFSDFIGVQAQTDVAGVRLRPSFLPHILAGLADFLNANRHGGHEKKLLFKSGNFAFPLKRLHGSIWTNGAGRLQGFQYFDVGQILGSSGCALVSDQVINRWNANPNLATAKHDHISLQSLPDIEIFAQRRHFAGEWPDHADAAGGRARNEIVVSFIRNPAHFGQ
jgi:hypothetical protein